MSVVQYKKYIWLVDTIRSAGKISRDQIDRKWASARINDVHESHLPDSTFFRYKKDIEELFDIDILCDRSTGEYYIDDSDLGSQTRQWLLSQFAVSQTLDTSRELRDRILYESIPEGTQYLTTIVNAMRDSKMLLVSHLRFDSKEKPHIFYLSPLCMKVFKQRWYVLGLVEELDGSNQTGNEPRIYSLDRVGSIEPLEKSFIRPKNFDPQAYFAPFYGVFCGKQYKPEFVRVRVSNEVSAKYLRSLPLHQSQKEVEPCVFEWYIALTFDFIQQLRTFGAEIEVLAPQSLRNQFAEEAQKILDYYKK